ncbi:class F sortase [Streptomyces sp. DW4-2]|uniref:Class F sortase n=1 Tax=Streptomyces spirodelae TaxID=2812904 RepID=A0ABS3WWL1_9ACTN|nr:class F sortase [Streptomyces spirodelae]
MPAQGVRADIVPVGTTRTHDLAVPSDPDDVGWYRFGARPGASSGAAVLVGHVDSRSGALGALASLSSAQRGDRVTVSGANGGQVHYRIVGRRSVAKAAFPSHLFRTSGPPALVLITCAAPFDPDHGGYQRLLIVTAVPAGRG